MKICRSFSIDFSFFSFFFLISCIIMFDVRSFFKTYSLRTILLKFAQQYFYLINISYYIYIYENERWAEIPDLSGRKRKSFYIIERRGEIRGRKELSTWRLNGNSTSVEWTKAWRNRGFCRNFPSSTKGNIRISQTNEHILIRYILSTYTLFNIISFFPSLWLRACRDYYN